MEGVRVCQCVCVWWAAGGGAGGAGEHAEESLTRAGESLLCICSLICTLGAGVWRCAPARHTQKPAPPV